MKPSGSRTEAEVPRIAETAEENVQPEFFRADTPSVNGDGAGSAVENFAYDEDAEVLVRLVETTHRDRVESLVPPPPQFESGRDELAAAYDRAWLRFDTEPTRMETRGEIRVLDLFSGCGGMTLGVAEACRALGLKMVPVAAVDVDRAALEVFGTNFPSADLRNERVEKLVDGELGAPITEAERDFAEEVGEVDVVVAGPPCQGSSDLNNHTRRDDPKNALYLRMARVAEVLEPTHIVVENVLGIRHDKNRVFQRTRDFFEETREELGYSVDTDVLRAEELGVPQNRHRVFLVASRGSQVRIEDFVRPFRTRPRSFEWACRDLRDSTEGSGFDAASTPAPVTRKRIDHLFDNDLHDLPDEQRPRCHREKEHSYPSVYGRMWNDRPSPTITTGFTAMGQGRFVHPTRRRTITPHEAARLQFFPDYFVFGERNRAEYKRLIGNAVPPKLTYVLGMQLLR